MSWQYRIKKEESTISKRRMRRYLKFLLDKLKEELDESPRDAVVYSISYIETLLNADLRE